MNKELPTAKWEMWTPQLAAEVLQQQHTYGPIANRPRRDIQVGRYAGDMKSGRWQVNGEAIKFNGMRLLDGQHRLAAVVASGCTMPFLTVRGVDPAAIVSMDSGLNRSSGDAMRAARPELVRGYYNGVAAAARVVYLYLQYGEFPPGPRYQPTRQQLIDTVDLHPGIVESYRQFARGGKSAAWLRSKTSSAWHYLCGRTHPTERDIFYENLINGIGLGEDQPVRVLRERLMAEQFRTAKVTSVIWSAYVVKAWNAELAGRPLKVLRYKPGEKFPLLEGDEI